MVFFFFHLLCAPFVFSILPRNTSQSSFQPHCYSGRFGFFLKERVEKKAPVDSLHITYFGGSEKLIPSAM